MELSDILSDKEPTTPAPEPKAEPEVKAEPKAEAPKEEKPRGPDGKFAPKEEPKEQLSEKERGLLAAAQEERRKRQDLERRLAELEKPKEQKTEEPKSFWDDPEGHLKKHTQEVHQTALATRISVTEAMAREKYKDFDQAVEIFAQALQETPGLHAQWLASANPAEFAYRVGKNTRELREAGNIDALREKIAKEERVKLEAEFKAKQEELDKLRAQLPGSLSSVRGATQQQRVAYTGPTTLDDILGRQS